MPATTTATSAFLLTLPALISIINPIGAALIFSQVTSGRADVRRVLTRVSLYSLAVMLLSLWAGSYILAFFGITLAALRIAGGLVIAIRAWTLLTAPEAHADRKKDEASTSPDDEDIAFYPLTLPFTTGPGTIAVTVAIGAERPPMGGFTSPGVIGFFAGASLACLVMAAIIWLTYRFADQLVARLGQAGANVLTRVIAFLLLCIGTQITANGLTQIIAPLLLTHAPG